MLPKSSLNKSAPSVCTVYHCLSFTSVQYQTFGTEQKQILFIREVKDTLSSGEFLKISKNMDCFSWHLQEAGSDGVSGDWQLKEILGTRREALNVKACTV